MANRSERRRNKNYQGVTSPVVDDSYEMRNLMIIIVVVVLLFAVVYLISTVFIDDKKQNSTTQLPTSTIQYESILYTNVFNRSDKEYYVLLYDLEAPQAQTVDYIYTTYQQKTEKLNVYSVDLSDKFNRDIVVTENSNSKATKPSELKVISPTLIHVKDGKVQKYVEGIEKISEILK